MLPHLILSGTYGNNQLYMYVHLANGGTCTYVSVVQIDINLLSGEGTHRHHDFLTDN